MTPELAKLYQEVILAHHRAPHHFGPLATATHRARLTNPLCGDEVIIAAQVDGTVVTACHFEGHGCALCRASASLLTDAVTGRSRDQIERSCEQLLAFLQTPQSADAESQSAEELGDLRALSGVRDYPSRRRCATLPWEALRSALAVDPNVPT